MADDVAHGVVEADIERGGPEGAVEDAVARRDGAAEQGGGLPDDLREEEVGRVCGVVLVCDKRLGFRAFFWE